MGSSKSRENIRHDVPNYGSAIITNNDMIYDIPQNNVNHISHNSVPANNLSYIESKVKETDYRKDKNYKRYLDN